MFVVSIIDNGDERNFVVTDVRVREIDVVVNAGGVEHVFRLADIIDILPIGVSQRDVKALSLRSRRLH